MVRVQSQWRQQENWIAYLNCSSLWSVAGCIGMVDVTGRSRLIDQVPRKDSRLILVHAPSDGVHTVCHGRLMVLVQLNHCWVDVELFWVLSTTPEDVAIQSISCSPVVCQSQDELDPGLVCFSYDLIKGFEGSLIVLTCRQKRYCRQLFAGRAAALKSASRVLSSNNQSTAGLPGDGCRTKLPVAPCPNALITPRSSATAWENRCCKTVCPFK